ncbi:MAG: Bug family tripartite tricarboxylate transporter substrate binding protein [Burkholderiales bacterium]
MRKSLLILALLGAPWMTTNAAHAQTYPNKPIRFVLNVSVGVLSDIVMRVGVVELGKQMGQPWVIENRQGGNFVPGAVACKNSAPDGYTVCLVNEQSISLNPHIIPNLPYDPDKDFKPVTNLYVQVSGVAAASTLAANSIGELQKLGAAKSAAMNFATLGPGTTQDILRQWMNNKWKTEFVGVPYKGMNVILNAIVAGESNLTQTSLGSAGAYLASGKVKLLAVNSAKRLAKLPEVPTFTEAGLGEFIDVQGRFWWGLVVPAGVPDAIVQRLNGEFTKLFREPKFAEFIDAQYLDAVLGTPEQFAAFIKTDRERARMVVKTFNVPML